MKFLRPIYAVLLTLTVIAASSCSDKDLESRLNGSWHADMSYKTPDGKTIKGGIDLVLDAASNDATLIVSAPGGEGILPQYKLTGSWNAKNSQLTLNLSNKPLQDHIDMIASVIDSLAGVHPGIDTVKVITSLSIDSALQTSLMAQKKVIESKLADPSLKASGITALNDSIRAINGRLAAISLKVDQALYARYVKEQNLLDALRKNVGCISTMNIDEITDSTLTLGDKISKITFRRVKQK